MDQNKYNNDQYGYGNQNGYQNVSQGGYQNGYQNGSQNGYQNGYQQFTTPPDPNMYNPIPAPNQYKNCKTRSTIATLLCTLLGILFTFIIILVGVRFGIMSSAGIKDIFKDIGLTDIIKDEIIKSEDIHLSDDTIDSVEESMGNIVAYTADALLEGKTPNKDDMYQDIAVLYDAVAEECVEQIVSDIKAEGGSIGIDDISNLESAKIIENMVGREYYDAIVENLEEEIGEIIIVDSSNEDKIKAEINKVIDENSEEVISYVVDEVYDVVVEVSEIKVGDSNIGEIITDVVGAISNALLIAMIILSVLSLIIIVVVFLIDKQVSVSLRGIGGSALVSSIIILVITGITLIVAKVFGDMTVTMMGQDIDIFKIVLSFISPIMITAGVALALGIIMKIVGTVTKPKNDDAF